MLQIVPIKPAEARILARMHCTLLQGSILVELGYYFLAWFYYKILVQEKQIRGYLAYFENQPAVFITYTLDVINMLKSPGRHHFLRLGLVLAMTVLMNPAAIVAILRVLTQLLQEERDNIPVAAEILSFAVKEEYRSREFVNLRQVKVSNELYTAVMADLRQAEVKEVKAMVKNDNVLSNIFYQHQQWKLVKTVYRFNQYQNIYVKKI